jgi:hypothetical protein
MNFGSFGINEIHRDQNVAVSHYSGCGDRNAPVATEGRAMTEVVQGEHPSPLDEAQEFAATAIFTARQCAVQLPATCAFRARMTVMESYVERPPLPELAGVVRTVWIHRTGEAAYVQRHLPTGGVEIHFPIGGHPQLVGPLTGPEIEVIPPHTTIVGVRFQPGTTPPLPTVLDDLVDQRLGLAELWGSSAGRLVEAMALAGTPERALMFLQAHLVREFRSAVGVDPLVGEAVQALMPWHPTDRRCRLSSPESISPIGKHSRPWVSRCCGTGVRPAARRRR